MIRMNRQTTLPPVKQESGDYLAEIGSGEYTMTTIAFDAMESDALWLENMRALVHGRSDRAVRHVALQLERQARENPPVAWKATRRPFYSVEVLEISRPVDAKTLACKPDTEDRCCSICREDYGPKVEPMALHNSSHLVCEPCLITWCLRQGPKVRCPHVSKGRLTITGESRRCTLR